MGNLFSKKTFAGVFVFAVCQWLAYAAFTGAGLTDRTRGSTKGIEDLIGWLSGQVGNVPAAIIISLLDVVLGYYAYTRMEHRTEG